MKRFACRSVRYWPKEIDGTLPGGEKKFFLIRDIDGPARPAASTESCRFAVRRSPGVVLGSVLGRAQSPTPHAWGFRGIFRAILSADIGLEPKSPRFWIQGCESPKNRRMRCRRLPDPRPIPEGVREPICPRKSVQFGPDGAPSPSKRQLRRGPPVVAVAVSSDPILPHR